MPPGALGPHPARSAWGTVLPVRPCIEGLSHAPSRPHAAPPPPGWPPPPSSHSRSPASPPPVPRPRARSRTEIQGLSAVPDTGHARQPDRPPTRRPAAPLAKTSPGLLRITSPKKIPVMIKYDYDAVASYSGTVSGFAATSPSVTDRKLTAERVAESDYLRLRAGAGTRHHAPGRVRRARRHGDGELPRRVRRRGRHRAGQQHPPDPADARGRRGPARRAQPAADRLQPGLHQRHRRPTARCARRGTPARASCSATSTPASGPSIRPSPTRATCRRTPGPAIPCNFGDNPLTPAADPFVCNKKLVGGGPSWRRTTPTRAPGTCTTTLRVTPRATAHTPRPRPPATRWTTSQTLGPQLARINGIAPGAQIAEYRVCGPAGCYGSDTTAATEQAILDGVDVINYSISGGTQPMSDPTELAFLDAYAAGVFVATSAGNDGPGASTANHLSPWVMSVAASTQTREFASHLTLTADNGDTYDVDGVTDHRRRRSASGRPGLGAAVQQPAVPGPGRTGHCSPASSSCASAAARPRAQGLQREAGRRRGDDPREPEPRRRGDRQPLAADDPRRRRHRPSRRSWAATPVSRGSFTAGAARNGQGDVMASFSSRGPPARSSSPTSRRPAYRSWRR